MAHDDDDEIAVIARPALLAELARRFPDSPEGRALAISRLVLGVAVCCHLDDGLEGLMLVVELDDLRVARVGYTLDPEGRRAVRYQLHGVARQAALIADGVG